MNKLFLLRESKELHMICQSWVCVIVVGEWKWRGWENWAKIDSKTKGWTSSPFHTTQGKIFPWEISLFTNLQCKIPIMSSWSRFGQVGSCSLSAVCLFHWQQTMEDLIQAGHELVEEQKMVMSMKLSEEYMKTQRGPGGSLSVSASWKEVHDWKQIPRLYWNDKAWSHNSWILSCTWQLTVIW